MERPVLIVASEARTPVSVRVPGSAGKPAVPGLGGRCLSMRS